MWRYILVLAVFLVLIAMIAQKADAACREIVENGVTVYKCDRPKRERVEEQGKVERWGGNRSRNVGYGKVKKWSGM